jgi:hypothetical protein
MLLGGLWGDSVCHERMICIIERYNQPEERLLGKRFPVEIGLEPPRGLRRKAVKQIFEAVFEGAFFNSSKASVSASSIETESGGAKADFVMSEGSISKTLPVGGLVGYVIKTVLDEEAPEIAKVLEDSVLGVESGLQDSPLPPRNDSAARRSKATKSDSDEAPVFMWSEFLFKRVFKTQANYVQNHVQDHGHIMFTTMFTIIFTIMFTTMFSWSEFLTVLHMLFPLIQARGSSSHQIAVEIVS